MPKPRCPFGACAGKRDGAGRLPRIFVPNFTLGGVDKSALSKEAGPRTQSIKVPADLIGKDETGGAFDATMVKLQVSNT